MKLRDITVIASTGLGMALLVRVFIFFHYLKFTHDAYNYLNLCEVLLEYGSLLFLTVNLYRRSK